MPAFAPARTQAEPRVLARKRSAPPVPGSGAAPAWAAPVPAAAPPIVPVAGGAAREPASKRPAAPRHRRDITRSDVAIPAAPSAPLAASAAAAAAGGGASPAVLSSVLPLLIAFLVGVLLEVAGLLRLPLRGARLERPG